MCSLKNGQWTVKYVGDLLQNDNKNEYKTTTEVKIKNTKRQLKGDALREIKKLSIQNNFMHLDIEIDNKQINKRYVMSTCQRIDGSVGSICSQVSPHSDYTLTVDRRFNVEIGAGQTEGHNVVWSKQIPISC